MFSKMISTVRLPEHCAPRQRDSYSTPPSLGMRWSCSRHTPKTRLEMWAIVYLLVRIRLQTRVVRRATTGHLVNGYRKYEGSDIVYASGLCYNIRMSTTTTTARDSILKISLYRPTSSKSVAKLGVSDINIFYESSQTVHARRRGT